MAGLFIDVAVDEKTASNAALVGVLAEVCPVNIFGQREDGGLDIIQGNVDECTLCELCLDAAEPGAVRVIKLYDEGRALERSA